MAPSVTINTTSSAGGSEEYSSPYVTTITLDGASVCNVIDSNIEGFVHHGFCRTKPNVDLYYALFGTGPIKVVLLMGIATSGFAWKHTIEWLVRHPQYQVCAVDNRGCGKTTGPAGRLTTSAMAQDVVALIEHLKWDSGKVHLVGNSLGGMIAQEVAIAIPNNLASLTLIATHAGGWMTKIPPLSAMVSIFRRFFLKDELRQTEAVLETVFSKEHLKKPGHKDHLSAIKGAEYPTILDFYHDHANASFEKLFCTSNAPMLFMQQLSAVLTHWVDGNRLAEVRDKVPTLVITGTGDKIVDSSHSYWLADALKADLLKFHNAGHAVSEECLDEVTMALHKHFSRNSK